MAARENDLLQGRVGQPMNGGFAGWPNAWGWTLNDGLLARIEIHETVGFVLRRHSVAPGTGGHADLGGHSSSWNIRREPHFGSRAANEMSRCALSSCYRSTCSPAYRPLPLRHAHHRPFCHILESLKLSSVGHGWWTLLFRFYRSFRLAFVAFASP